MQYAFLGLALAAAVTAQGVIEPLYPDGVDSPPPNSNFLKNAFSLNVIKLNESQEVGSTAADCTNVYPKVTLTGSALIDQRGSTGSIVANDQFQFDGPPQAGVKVSAGWYRNENGTLGLGNGDDASVFYQCDSGNLINLYRTSLGEQCIPIYLALQLCTSSSSDGAVYEPVKKENTGVFQIPEGSGDDSLPDGGNGVSRSSATASSSSSASATSAESSASSSSSSIAMAPATMLTESIPTTTPVAPVVAPPASNGTAAAPTGSVVTPPSSSSSAPAPFTNAAPAVAVGQKAIALLAAVAAAFAMA